MNLFIVCRVNFLVISQVNRLAVDGSGTRQVTMHAARTAALGVTEHSQFCYNVEKNAVLVCLRMGSRDNFSPYEMVPFPSRPACVLPLLAAHSQSLISSVMSTFVLLVL